MTAERKVSGQWHSGVEHVTFDSDHGLIVLPDGDDAHRVYFAGTPEQLAQILASPLAWAEGLPLQVLDLAERVKRDNEGTGEWRMPR